MYRLLVAIYNLLARFKGPTIALTLIVQSVVYLSGCFVLKCKELTNIMLSSGYRDVYQH